jgi:hypothetical protein
VILNAIVQSQNAIMQRVYIEKREYPMINSIWKPGQEHPATGARLCTLHKTLKLQIPTGLKKPARLLSINAA